MTKRINQYRPRRINDDEIPPHVARFFEHGGAPPWEALMWDYEDRIKNWWRKFSAEHPDIPPPDNVPWLKLTAADSNSDAQTRDGQTAQSADEKTDARTDAVSLTKKDAET